MATFSAKMDFGDLDAVLDHIEGPVRESLARRMGVEGGVLLRDEAKHRASYNNPKWRPRHPGLWASAMYLARNDRLSSQTVFTYSVGWNSSIAPHGYLVEFGHWRYNKFINGKPQHSLRPGLSKGKGPQDHVPPGALETPQWVAARPVLRPTWESRKSDALNAMIERGRHELPILLRGDSHDV